MLSSHMAIFEQHNPVTIDNASLCRAIKGTISCGSVEQIQRITFRNDKHAYK